MSTLDPEKNEPSALFEFADFSEKHVLEIGCGDGRLTWLYSDKAKHVTAIEPSAEQVAVAKENIPDNLQGRVEFHAVGLEDFAANSKNSIFDLIILSYSLC